MRDLQPIDFKRKRYAWFSDAQGRAAKIAATLGTPEAREAARANYDSRRHRACGNCGLVTQAYHVLREVRTIGRPVQYACRALTACDKRRHDRETKAAA
jgi:hypothetical protein